MPSSSKFLAVLVGIYAVLFTVLAFNPVDRATWFVENLTVWILLAVILVVYALKVRFSKTAYAFMFVLIYLHTIGGHWTFALVPFDFVTDLFGFERNHFDRVAHFSVGFYAFAVAEWLWTKRLVANKFLLFTYPVFVIAAVAMSYELIEWIYAASANPEAGIAYLGSQGDIWDAQKDMLADTLGALTAVVSFFAMRKIWKEKVIMVNKNLFLFALLLLCFPLVSLAVEIPMDVSPKEVVVEKVVSFDEELKVEMLPDGTPGYLSVFRGDGAMKDGDHTQIPLSGIRYTLHFWNVGEAGGESGFWLWKKKYADATLTVNYEVVGPGNKWVKMEKGFMGTDSFQMEVPNANPEFNPVVYNLTFSGGPDGEFNEKRPYRNKKGNPLWGSVENGEVLGLNFPPNVETGDNPFRVETLPFGTLNLDKDIFGNWQIVKEDCIDSLASFNSINGTVEVKKIDQGDWIFAKYDMVLCAGDIIKTGEESQAHVLWPYKDYFLGPETTLLIKKMPKPSDRTAVEIIGGKIKANFQKALDGKDIYSEEGYPNYVMGIKGTTIELEAGSEQSVFRLFEGSVELTYKNDTSKKIMVAAGDEILTKADGVMEKNNFDATTSLAAYEAEKKTWIPTANKSVEEKIRDGVEPLSAGQAGPGKSIRYIIFAIAVVIIFFGIVIIKIRKRKIKV